MQSITVGEPVEKLFEENKSVIDLQVCPDGKTLTYNLEQDIWLRETISQPQKLGTGNSLRQLNRTEYTFCEGGQLFIFQASGTKKLIKAKGKILKNLEKGIVQNPVPSPDGSKVACGLGGITKPNQWGARAYCGYIDLIDSKFEIFDLETYCGNSFFLPSSDVLVLNAMEIKGGAIYLINFDGAILGQFIGAAPACSPSGEKIAYRKEGAITVVANTGKNWELTDRSSQPEQGMGGNYNAPVWLDDQRILYDSNEEIFLFELSKNNAKKVADAPGLAIRRKSTIAGPYNDGAILLLREEDKEVAYHLVP